jgi:16S rRNA (cytosine1402-N4)-methyltransferase
VVEQLRPREHGTYVDATLGAGGHAEALLVASEPSGRIIGFDRDPFAVEACRRRLTRFGERFTAVLASFAEISARLAEIGIAAAEGILADLGLSSVQLASSERGFAFSIDGPLDMRFDPTQGPSAADLVNELDPERIEAILREYGEERRARAIARRIVSRRPIETTAELRSVVHSVVGPRRRHGIDPATRTFQALRIAVNQELAALELFMSQAPGLLARGGRLAVISYHSLEDRIVKHSMRDLARREVFDASRYRVLTKKPIVAGSEETQANPRARSAKLRVLERVA